MLVHDYLIRSASSFPDKAAIVHGKRRLSYSEILSRATGIAAWLRDSGLKKADRVAILNDEPSEYVSSYFGIMMAGGIVVALNSDTSARVLEVQLNRCEASAVITQPRFLKYFQELAPRLPSVRIIAFTGLMPSKPNGAKYEYFDLQEALDFSPRVMPRASDSEIAQIIYTSGTTGAPSAVMLRHSNLVANTGSIVKYLKLGDSDSVMAVLPFYYSYGNSVLLTHISVGGSLVVNQNFLYPNTVLEQMASHGVTGFSGVPSTFAILLHKSTVRRSSLPALRYMTQAGGAMAPKLAAEMKSIFPKVDFFVMYGQTEASARLSYLEPSELLRKAGSIGKAIPGVRLEVLDENGAPVEVGAIGEIVASGDNIMAGYWGEPEKTSRVLRDGRLWTGDLARVDEEGFLYIVSRKSDIIKSGSHRIHPKEIEEAIAEHPMVHEAAVTGVKDDILGEAIEALVVLNGGPCTERDILGHCRALLPAHKVPHSVEFVATLPKTSSGKINRALLKERTGLGPA